MRNIGNGAAAVLLVGTLAGCANLHTQPANYDDLPGTATQQMAKGPGVINGGHYDADTNSFLLYSSDQGKKAVLPSLTGHRQSNQSAQQASAATTPSQTPPMPNQPTGQPPGPSQQSNYQQFEQFQRYQQFQQMPTGSPEKQKFDQWQQWQQFKQWQRSQQQQ